MKKPNINKETLINSAMFIGGLSLLVTSAHVKDDKVVWNMLKAVPGELLIVRGLLSQGENIGLTKVNALDLRDSEGNVCVIKKTPFLKNKK